MTDLERELLDLLKAEHDRNGLLLQSLLRRDGLADEKIIVPESISGVGRKPWDRMQKELEDHFKSRPVVVEQEEKENASEIGTSV